MTSISPVASFGFSVPGHARGHSTRNLDHIFAAQSVRFFRKLCVFLGAKDNLCQSFAIAQIDENDAAVIARDVHPAGKRDRFADVAFAKLNYSDAFYDMK